jgi:hypothetical protein
MSCELEDVKNDLFGLLPLTIKYPDGLMEQPT